MSLAQDRKNVLILFFSLVVVMLGFGIIIPIMPFYIDHLGAGGSALGALMAIFAIMQLIFAPIWGQLSDRYGRKPVLIVGVLGNAIAQILFGLSTQLWMLYVARALAGILSSATMPAAMAYIGDSTSKKERGGGMGLMGAAMGVGMVLGPGIGGWTAVYGLATPFFVAGGLSLLAMVLIFLILPESLPVSMRVDSAHQGKSESQIRQLWQALFSPIGTLLMLVFLLSFGLTNFEGVFGLYALKRYGYDTQQVGTILTVVGLTSAIVQGMLTGVLTKRWGEETLIKVAFLGCSVGFLLMLQATTFVTVLLTASFFVLFNSLLRPATSSLISLRTAGGQGAAMGLNNAFMSLGRIVGPLWAGTLFDFRIDYPYLSGSVIMFIGFLASAFWLKRSVSSQTTAYDESQEVMPGS